jgi:ABC-2 type transport system ATP-binding protein
MIEVRGLVKRYGAKTAVDGLTFGIEPGKVTGFLGPNGSGKTTTMRCILGLDYADEGTITMAGRQYRDMAYPMREVGAPTTICCAWRRPTTCPSGGSARCLSLSACPT